MSPTDEELAVQALRGSEDAFATLVTAYQHKTYGLALHLLRNPEDAADATQETFVRCYSSLQSFDHNLSFGAWLYRIAYNHCLDVLRRRKRTPTVQPDPTRLKDPVGDAPDLAPGVEELVERSLTVDDVTTALDRISEDQRHILVLRYTLDLSYQQMAGVLGIPESTVTMRLHHAKTALRRHLPELKEESDGTS